ncbi:nucleoside phosphorylase [Patescibacteria group bacterium]|nr:nucleoside phosphorylase [Patescibacteria group bacterium]
MEWHIKCDAKDIQRYVFCPGDQARAKKIAEYFENARLITEGRGYVVYSGEYQGVGMTAIGTGMGGPVVAIGLEELAHMGADTFIRVGSCGVFQDFQQVGDVIIASGTVREGGTSLAYLPLSYPAVPSFSVLRALVEAGEELGIAATVGVGVAGDAFYAPRADNARGELLKKAGVVSVEMESDTLFIAGQYRGWRTGAIYASDGTNKATKPEDKEADFRRGEQNAILIALKAMWKIAQGDK